MHHNRYGGPRWSENLHSEEADSDQQVLVELRDLILTETPQWVVDIRSAAADKDIERMRAVLDALKGSMSVFGIESVCRSASAIEQLIERNDVEQIDSELTKLKAICRGMLREMRRIALTGRTRRMGTVLQLQSCGEAFAVCD